MVLGMSIGAFTVLHVVLSLIGIATGIVVVFEMWGAKTPRGLAAVFLGTTVATSVTGFLFPSDKITPADFEFVTPSNVRAVRIYTYFRNEQKSKRGTEIGWTASSYYDFSARNDGSTK